MKTRFFLFVVVMAVVALVSPAHGATEQGMVELGGSAAFTTYVSGYSSGVWVYDTSTQVSYFISDALSIGGRLTFAGVGYGLYNSSTLGLYAVADMHLDPSSTVVPFFGGAFGFDQGGQQMWYYGWGSGDTDVVIEFHGGVKAFLRDNIAVTMEARYRTPLEDFADYGEFSLLAGISVFLF